MSNNGHDMESEKPDISAMNEDPRSSSKQTDESNKVSNPKSSKRPASRGNKKYTSGLPLPFIAIYFPNPYKRCVSFNTNSVHTPEEETKKQERS
jgi:hypothetical protein